MFKISKEKREQLLKYLMARPYAEVAQIIAMIASLEPVIVENKKNDGAKKEN